jgi:peptide/nickel transport system ATP-binding protein
MNPLVELHGVWKRYQRHGIPGISRGHGVAAVRGVDLDIPRGSIYGLVGESGCGKTTLARTILRLEPVTAGQILFDGTDLARLRGERLRRFRRRMQIVFQDPNGALDPHLSVRTSLGEGLRNLGRSRADAGSAVDEAARSVGIPETHLDRKPFEFSGGQKQRLVIARALTMEPEFLVLDEPVSNLDVSVQAQIVNLLVDLKAKRDLTYLFISHDLNLVAYLCDHIAVMYAGRIVEIGPAGELIADPLHPYTRRLFASAARIVDHGRIFADDQHVPVHERTVSSASAVTPETAGCAFAPSCDYADSQCVAHDAPLVSLGGDRAVACFRAKLTKA